MRLPNFRVQTPPVGYFNSKDVHWVKGSAKKSPFQQAYILSDRVEDFIDGECVRGDTDFWVAKTRTVPNGWVVRG